jgi:hypothetical protein
VSTRKTNTVLLSVVQMHISLPVHVNINSLVLLELQPSAARRRKPISPRFPSMVLTERQ